MLFFSLLGFEAQFLLSKIKKRKKNITVSLSFHQDNCTFLFFNFACFIKSAAGSSHLNKDPAYVFLWIFKIVILFLTILGSPFWDYISAPYKNIFPCCFEA